MGPDKCRETLLRQINCDCSCLQIEKNQAVSAFLLDKLPGRVLYFIRAYRIRSDFESLKVFVYIFNFRKLELNHLDINQILAHNCHFVGKEWRDVNR